MPERLGIAYILSTRNNTHVHITDLSGAETVAWCTGGMVVKADRFKNTPYVAIKITNIVAEKAKERGFKKLIVKVSAGGGRDLVPGPGANMAIRTLRRAGFELKAVEIVTPIPHDGVKLPGGRRGRRL